MSAASENQRRSADYTFLANGAVTLFLKREVLDAAVAKLEADGYRADEIRGDSERTIYEDIGRAYDWETHFGYHLPENPDALWDGVTSLNGPKRLLVLLGFDRFFSAAKLAAHTFLDLLENAAWHNLLFGERLAVFVQVTDPQFEMQGLGAREPVWNSEEMLAAERRL